MKDSGQGHQGQSTVEYAFLMTIVVAAVLGVAMYLNRGFQGRFRRAAEFLGPLYGPGLVQSNENTTMSSQSAQSAVIQGTGTARTRLTASNTTQTTTRTRTEALTDNTGTGLFE